VKVGDAHVLLAHEIDICEVQPNDRKQWIALVFLTRLGQHVLHSDVDSRIQLHMADLLIFSIKAKHASIRESNYKYVRSMRNVRSFLSLKRKKPLRGKE
jgi:hypothetical protein